MEQIKLQTPVQIGRSRIEVSLRDSVVSLGSCFADNIGEKMAGLGFDILANPFGTLYNPVSVCNSAARLASGVPFTTRECVQMGAGSGRICSLSRTELSKRLRQGGKPLPKSSSPSARHGVSSISPQERLSLTALKGTPRNSHADGSPSPRSPLYWAIWSLGSLTKASFSRSPLSVTSKTEHMGTNSVKASCFSR